MDIKQQVDQLLERMAALHQQESVDDAALEEIASAVRELPFRVRLMQKLGDLYVRAERQEEASEAYLQVGRYYREQEAWPKASATFRHILKHDKHHWNARKQLAEVLVKEERVGEAVDEYRWVSRYFYNQGDLESAAQYRYKILELQPDNIVQRVKLAEILIEMKQHNNAVAQFEQALELLEEQGFWRDLIKVAERLLYIAPQHLYALKLTARVYLENNEPMKALNLLRQALHQSSQDPEVLKLLTIAFDKIRQPVKTLKVLHKLAEVYEGRDQLNLAREVYLEILQRDPDDRVSRESLAAITAMSTADITEAILGSEYASEEAKKTASRGGLLSVQRIEEIHKQLQHCNVEPEQLDKHLLEKIEHRSAPPGRKLSRWPEVIRRRVDGEILYDGRYLLTDVLRRDAFGTQFRAIDIQQPSRYVCILRPDFSEQLTPEKQTLVEQWRERVEPFLDFSHPHLLSVLAAGYTEEGYPYLLSEYCDGEPLTSVRDALSPLQLFELFYQLLHTVEYIHSRGVMHGNISPSYVLKNKDGEIKLDGFALVSLLGFHAETPDVDTVDGDYTSSDELPLLTLPHLIGSPGFIAPELLLGQPVSRQSDVFSLGCLLYYMAHHERPTWSVERQIGDAIYTAVTRGQDDPVPALELGEAPHMQFLEQLFPQMVAYLPQTRINLREAQVQYTSFIQRDGNPLYSSAEDNTTDNLFALHLVNTSRPGLASDDGPRLPGACLDLPFAVQQKLQQLLARIEQMRWFRPGDNAIQRGAEQLQVFLQRISPFANAPLIPQVTCVRSQWDTLQSRLVQASDLEPSVKEVVEATLADNPNSWALAGKAAWDAIHAFEIPEGHLLPFDVASAAVSSSAWSAAWSPVWAGARSAAWNTAKAIAKAAGRTAAWNAAKTAAWTAAWPAAKTVAPPDMRTSARAAASDASWCAAWLVASDQIADQPNPFEPLFAIWELGLYPMLLFDGNYVLVAIDNNAGESFDIQKVSESLPL